MSRPVSPNPVRKPGRPRSESSRQAILDAALLLLNRDGYRALNVEGIARAAGVGKQTIYRWWPSKADVILEALRESSHQNLQIPDQGSLPDDLAHFLRATFRAISGDGGSGPLLRALMAEAQRDEEFSRSFREVFIEARRAALGVLFARAKERGEIEAAAPSDLLVDLVYGVLWYRLLVGHAPLNAALARSLAQVITAAGRGLAR